MTLICDRKISAELRLIHAEQISLYKFRRFQKKRFPKRKFLRFPKLYKEMRA